MPAMSRRRSSFLLMLFVLLGIASAIRVIQTQEISRLPAIVGIVFPIAYAGVVLAYLKRYFQDEHADTLLWTVTVASYLLATFYFLATIATIWAQEVSGGEIVDELIFVMETSLSGAMLGLVIGHMYGQATISRRQLADRERELEKQVNRLDEFANVVSHDLRNPLNVAEGRLQAAAEECDSDHLDAVDRALDRMGELIEDMLSLARAGRDVGDFDPVALSDLVSGCWFNVANDSAELINDTDVTVRADSTRLQQLLENLLRNGVEHGGPDVTIEVGDIPGGFYVEDDGPGIPVSERENVLRPGYSSTETGTGFGLSIVREIAQAHGWEIIVTESTRGGARFEFSGIETE